MNFDIKLGFLAADAISEYSKATSRHRSDRYSTFLERCDEYCREVKRTYGRAVDTDILATMPNTIAEFMRAVIKSQQPSPAIAAKLQAVSSLEALLSKIREEQRDPSEEECLSIAKTVYTTSAADPS